MDTSSWFGKSSVAQKNAPLQTPGFGQGPLAAPEPAPVPAVERLSTATTSNIANSTASHGVATTTAKPKVAILLPLTGKNAALGQSMLNAAQQAVFDVAGENFELMPRDTGSDDMVAATAARDAVASGAQLLIGPVFASNIPAVLTAIQNTPVNILTLSSDTSLAAPGVFVMGFAPKPQVERVVSYAISRGLRHFAALIPNNAYGALVGQAFQEAVARNGGIMVDFETYDPLRHDSNDHIQVLAQKRDQIDAVFLPEGGNELEQISGQLSIAGFNNRLIRFLGTGLWDEPTLGQKNTYVIGGWYAASDPAPRQRFMKSYVAAYGQEPPRLVTLAYDATALAAVLAKRGAPYTTSELTNPNGFVGLDGIFRLTSQGLTERGLAINEVTTDGGHVIDAAPTSFAGLHP